MDSAPGFDSLKREDMVQTLMKYKIRVHHKIVSATAIVYTQERTEIHFGEIVHEIEVKNGI